MTDSNKKQLNNTTKEGKKRFSCNLSPEVWLDLKDAAYTLRITQADFIELCVVNYIKQSKLQSEEKPENTRVRYKSTL